MAEEILDSEQPDQAAESDDHARWCAAITIYEKESQRWHEKAKKILRRYKDERGVRDAGVSRYNILYSNVQTLTPALYAKNPKPDIERRFKDDDNLGRVTSDVLERCTSYFVADEVFGAALKQAVVDRLLPGRGTVWVRYVPHFRDVSLEGQSPEIEAEGAQITDDVYSEEDKPADPVQEVYYEEVCPDYVHWEDFGHTIGRTWEEVVGVWRKVYLDRAELIERFGEELGERIPLDYSPKGLNDEKVGQILKKATIYEIWDKKNKRAIWLHKVVPELLDNRPDPLRLPDFFPCPKPLYPLLVNDSLIPVPDYVQYQDQANELDDLTARIASITKAIKVAGVYDASAQGLERLLAEGVENQLIPVDAWAVFAEKGGMNGAMALLPVLEIAQTLLSLYEARERVKQDLYEITGISDIVRGATDAGETATAQRIKGQFATLRLDAMQADVQRFARDVVRLMAVVIAEHFQLETIKQISGVKLLTTAEKQQMVMAAQQPGPDGQPVQLSDKKQEMLQNPTWEEVDALLKDDAARCFKIEIETNSTIKMDQDAEREARMEFLTAAGGFMQQAAQVQDLALKPLLAQMLMFGVRGFSVGKELEGAFSVAMQKIEKEAASPQPQPNPEMMKIEAQKEADAAKMQLEAQKMQADQQFEVERAQADMQIERYKADQQLELERYKAELQMLLEVQKMALQQETEIAKAKINAEASVEAAKHQPKPEAKSA